MIYDTDVMHSQATNTEFMTKVMNGTLTQTEYTSYCVQQYELFVNLEKLIYECAERSNDPHTRMIFGPVHQKLKSYFRSQAIDRDLVELDVRAEEIKVHLSTQLHIDRFDYLYSSTSPSRLIPHVLILYLALLRGGQIIAKKLKKQGFPTNMYHFENIDDVNTLADELKTICDTHGNDDKTWLKEAHLVYLLTIGMMNDVIYI